MSTTEADLAAQLVYPPHAARNAASLYNIKFLSAAFVGAIAGVLGLENWQGFTLYALSILFTTTLVYAVRCKGDLKKHFHGSLWDLANPGQDNMFSFVLSWTLFYGPFSASHIIIDSDIPCRF